MRATVVALGLSSLLAVSTARAQYRLAEPARTWGLGTAVGVGFAAGTLTSSTGAAGSGIGGALLLPSLEAHAFFGKGFSIDITVPISNIIIVSAVLGVVAFNTDLFFNANIGPGRVRLLIGPGVGFSVVAGGGYSGGSIRLPAVIGMEILTRSYGVGFRFMLRPWLEYAIGSSGRTSVTGIGGGALAVFGVSFYGKRDASPAYPAYPPP